MREKPIDRVRVALRQLEHAEDYLQAVANVLPELEEDLDHVLEEVAVLKQDLTQRRLAG